MIDYDPVQCLQAEVDRFKSTNTFTAMQVTGFYLQAACVLTELRRSREDNERLKREVKNLRLRVDNLELEVMK